MTRLCERPGCSERGAIAYGFDADRLLVWLSPLDPDADRKRAGTLCIRHADAMVVPRGWTLDDARDPMPAPVPPAPRNRVRRGAQARHARRRTADARPNSCRSDDGRRAEEVRGDPTEGRTVAAVTGVLGRDRSRRHAWRCRGSPSSTRPTTSVACSNARHAAAVPGVSRDRRAPSADHLPGRRR